MRKWTKIDRGWYGLSGTRYAVQIDGYERSQSVGAEQDRYEGFVGGEWAVIKYRTVEGWVAGQDGDNLDWYPTMWEARACAERIHKRAAET